MALCTHFDPGIDHLRRKKRVRELWSRKICELDG